MSEGTTTAGRRFYTFVPAREAPARKPIFLFINGGPGAATSSALAAWGTGPFTVTDTGGLVENPADFSRLGNLVYIDTRQAGFSFDEIANPADPSARDATFTAVNYNIFTDSADVLLTFLAVLDAVLQRRGLRLLGYSGASRILRTAQPHRAASHSLYRVDAR